MKGDYISHRQNDFFDKYLFRWHDIIRIFIKKIFTTLKLRDRQSCKHCGRDQKIIWTVNDAIWNKLPRKYREKALCLECFVELHPYQLKQEDFIYISFTNSDKLITHNKQIKTKSKPLSKETLDDLIDSDIDKEGTVIFVTSENANYTLIDGEWEKEGVKRYEDEDEDDGGMSLLKS